MDVRFGEYGAELPAPWALEIGSGSLEDKAADHFLRQRLSATTATTALAVTIAIFGPSVVRYADAVEAGGSTGSRTSRDAPYSASVFEYLSPRQKLVSLKERLGLTVTRLAQILNVQRPTIYSWLSDGVLRPANLARLNSLYRLSEEWIGRTQIPLAEALRQGELSDPDDSILSLLTADEIDAAAILPAFDRLVAVIELQRNSPDRTLASKLRDRGFNKPLQAGSSAAEMHFQSYAGPSEG